MRKGSVPSYLPGPEGAGDAVVDPSPEEEPDEEDVDVEAPSDEEPWCPPTPDPPAEPTEEELSGAAEKETKEAQMQSQTNIFFTPCSLGALPALWLQAKLTISLAPFQDKFSKLFLTIAAELG